MREATPIIGKEDFSVLSAVTQATARTIAAVLASWLLLGLLALLVVPFVCQSMGLPRTSAQLANVLCVSLRTVIIRPWTAVRAAAALWAKVLAPVVAAALAMDAVREEFTTARLRCST